MTERPVEGDHPDYQPGKKSPSQGGTDGAEDDVTHAPESGDKQPD
ncbi:hypothetical protein C7434_0261 [Pantoea sp. PNA 14-12]|nr:MULTISPECIES: hypothetical protein [Pantoea]MCU7368434.1 hypothetical protein [Pantoea stewartii]MDF7784161.1 hypothetical protein [Pantoea stewartii]MDK2633217.1 hypothetical protein [Pantoea stewartii subsp. indologenes]PXV79047.1 hypothetical protein C7433_1011286 [Pantoea sp. PNA 03-3]TDS71495.1 hypothetical protein C7434_0261 [Pantoea sp. PNA 14-12]